MGHKKFLIPGDEKVVQSWYYTIVDFGAVHLNLNIEDEGDDVLGDG